MGHALSYRITAKLRKDIRHGHFRFLAGYLDIPYDLIDHELVVVIEPERMLDRKSTPYIDRIQFRTDLFQLAIKINDLVQFAPVVYIILDPFVQEDMQHFQLKLAFVSLYP